jgi:excisionase family DNA binding protein
LMQRTDRVQPEHLASRRHASSSLGVGPPIDVNLAYAERAMQDVGNGYISTEEAARRAGYTVGHISILARSGRLLARRVRGRWLIDERALEAFATNELARKHGRKRGRPRKAASAG